MTLSQHSGSASSLAPLPVNFKGLPVKEQPASQSASADGVETDIPIALLHRQNFQTVGGRLRRLDRQMARLRDGKDCAPSGSKGHEDLAGVTTVQSTKPQTSILNRFNKNESIVGFSHDFYALMEKTYWR